MTKVVHIQIATQSTGRAALRLHSAFLARGIDSSIVTLRKSQNDDQRTKQKDKKALLVSKLDGRLQSIIKRRTDKKFGSFSYPILGTDVSNMEVVRKADFIYLHWALGGFLNFRSIAKLAELGKPLFFFMHDMWPITGGCHHSFSCVNYRSRCGRCPVLASKMDNDLSTKEFKKKLKLYSKYNNIFFISPSKWLAQCARESTLTKRNEVLHIPNVLDKEMYKKVDRTFARQVLNLAEEGIVLAFGATNIASPYKGWKLLMDALNIFSDGVDANAITVLIFGAGFEKEMASSIPFRTHFLGSLTDEYSTVLAYNAADVFIAPSLADNLPTTVLESLSCGTPVVGFETGGIPDMVLHEQNGYLARYGDGNDLAAGIKFCLDNQIHGYSLPEFGTELIINRHIDLFKKWGQI